MWSMGSLLLEIITGFPLWLSMKGRVRTKKGKNIFGYGIFGVQGRDVQKIYDKQIKMLSNLEFSISKFDS